MWNTLIVGIPAGSAISMLWSSSKVRSMPVLLRFAGVKRCVSSGVSHSGGVFVEVSEPDHFSIRSSSVLGFML